MFLDFLYLLREQRVPVGANEWIAFEEALAQGLEGGRLDGFYHLGRALLVKSEGHYDAFDVAFARFFQGFDVPPSVKEALLRWLDRPEGEQNRGLPPVLEDAALMEEFKKLLETQKERHDGGMKYIGTRGISPFGNQGVNPQGMRVGGQSAGGRSAIYQAESREFQNYRTDVKLETRQFKVALKQLRRFEKEGRPVLQLDPTIKKTADNGGEIDLIFGPDRKNSVKLLLLMDAGGSMDPYADVVSRLFSAAFAAHHFKRFEYYYFHNCVYGRIYKDIAQRRSVPTQQMLRDLPQDFRVVFVGDACMAPWELTAANDLVGYGSTHHSGLDWLKRIKAHFRGAVWLNPEPKSYWNHPTISQIGAVVPMFELTLDGLNRAMRLLRVGRRDLR
jgi:hypothetical protein